MAKNTLRHPSSRPSGFIIGIIAVILIAAITIGLIVWKQKEKSNDLPGINAEVSVSESSIQLKANNPTSDAKVVDIYEDYSCHFCAQLNDEDSESLKSAIESGKLIVNFRTLNFLNERFNNGSNLGGTTSMIAAGTGDSSLFWRTRSYLFLNQRNVAGKWESSDYQKKLEDLGASPDVSKTIHDESTTNRFLEMAKSNSDSLQKEVGEVSSPRVFVDGSELRFGQDADFSNWVEVALQR